MRSLPYFILTVLLLVGCAPDQKAPQSVTSQPTRKKPSIPAAFQPDSAYQYIEDQVNFGPRVPNTLPHKETAKYLQNKLKAFGANVTVQEATVEAYNGDQLEIYNIIGRLFPEKEDRIMLFAHWDTRHISDRDDNPENKDLPLLGANDGGSGVGVILEIARSLASAQEKPNVGIDIVFFDAEDYGQPNDVQMGMKADTWCLGSQYWARNQPIKDFDPRYGILLDMVGAGDAVFPQDAVSLAYAEDVVNKVWSMANRLGYGAYFTGEVIRGGITDDHLYVNQIAKIPSIDIIHYDVNRQDFGHFHHTQKDNMDVINKTTLKVVGEVVLAVIYSE